MATNDFVPFCNENTGSNLPTQSDYIANPNVPIGNQPGIASSSFVNKALRQGTTMGAIVAQLMADMSGANIQDNQNSDDVAIPTVLLSQIHSVLDRKYPVVTEYTSGSGNHNLTYKFQVLSANATTGATYTNNGVTYTVTGTISAGKELVATGNSAPTASGVLTKASGTGDATITFNAYRFPLYIIVQGAGPGGGGGGIATAASSAAAAAGGSAGAYFKKLITAPASTYPYVVGSGGAGGTAGNNAGSAGSASTTFGTSLLTAPAGQGGAGSAAASTVNATAQTTASSIATGGDINLPGGVGTAGIILSAGQVVVGLGGSNPLSTVVTKNGVGAGVAGNGMGGGGSGAVNVNNGGTAAGGAGQNGGIIVEEHYQ